MLLLFLRTFVLTLSLALPSVSLQLQRDIDDDGRPTQPPLERWVLNTPKQGATCVQACLELGSYECSKDMMCSVNAQKIRDIMYDLAPNASTQLVDADPQGGAGSALPAFMKFHFNKGTEVYLRYPKVADEAYFTENLRLANCDTTCDSTNLVDEGTRFCGCRYKEPQASFVDEGTGTCTVVEDPHVEVFDGAHVSLIGTGASTRKRGRVGEGVKWLVKSKTVSIQALYMADEDVENEALAPKALFVRAVAIGGPFLKGNVLVIGPLGSHITWNGMRILRGQSSSFEMSDEGVFVKATRSENSSNIADHWKTNPGVNIEFPMKVSLVANRLRHKVNLAITMPPQEGQDGVCGNFNGLAADDALEFSARRSSHDVQPSESLITSAL